MASRDHESEDESLYEDSPSDGYFDHHDVPQQNYVQDTEDASAAKAREARQRQASRSRGRQRSISPQSSRASLPSPSARSWISEEGPIRDAGPVVTSGPPPPAYFEALGNRSQSQVLADTAQTRYAGHPDESTALMATTDSSAGYGTHSSTPRTPFDDSRPPQSMSGDADLESYRSHVSTKPKRKRRRCGRIVSFLLKVVVALCVILVMTSFARMSQDDSPSQRVRLMHSVDWAESLLTPLQPTTPAAPDNDRGEKPLPPEKSTSTRAGAPTTSVPTAPTPTAPKVPTPTMPGVPSDHRAAVCAFVHYSQTYYYSFKSPKSFSLVEFLEYHQASSDIRGIVRVLPAGKDQAPDILVGIVVATTAHQIVKDVVFEVDSESLYLKEPIILDGDRSATGRKCIDVYIDVFVKSAIELSSFEIATEHLDLVVQADLFDENDVGKLGMDHTASGGLIVGNAVNNTEFNTVIGKIDIAYWSSRETRIETMTGSITGRYALRDLLSVKSQSGRISVSVDPKPADKTSPAPADFTASTASGSIDIKFPLDGHIPEREYRSRVESNSGSIEGSYLLGLMSSFRTTAGSITATVLPYAADLFASTLRTETRVGRTQLELLSPYKDPRNVINRLHSSHSSISGSLDLKYPVDWEGVVDAETTHGSLRIKGKDLEVVKRHDGVLGSRLVAKRGEGASRLDLSSTSGSIDAVIGREF